MNRSVFSTTYVEQHECACGSGSYFVCAQPVLRLDFPAGASSLDAYSVQELLDAFVAVEEVDLRCQSSAPGHGCGRTRQTRLRTWQRAPPVLMLQATRSQGAGKVKARLKEAMTIVLAESDLAVYDLVAVVEHEGETVRGGHCVCHAHCGDGWRTFDDHAVAPLGNAGARAEAAYLLFYARRGA